MQSIKINISFGGDEDGLWEDTKKYNVKGTVGEDFEETSDAYLEGKASDILAYLTSEDYNMDYEDAIEAFPELIK